MTATTLTYLAGREHVNDLLREAERNRRPAELVRLRRFRFPVPHLFARGYSRVSTVAES